MCDLFDSKINGKLVELTKAVEKNTEKVEQYRKDHKEDMAKIKPVRDGIQAITAGRKAIFWVTSLIVTIGAAVFTIRKIF
ncbi:MAG: hypothetical protein IIA88_06835 [Bacteroidetes bacterium]|nr:hypothetical protein [Bacteroidota bacterium]